MAWREGLNVPVPRTDMDEVTRVREATDIVRVIGQYVSLKPKGREFIGLCPFHDDHRPSMSVVPSKQIFKCFSCGAGGNVFTFLQRARGMEFREALEHLAEQAGIELRPRGRRSETDAVDETAIPRRELVRANEIAQSFFRRILTHVEHGQAAREMIARRGISEAMVESFEIGATPDRWDGLLQTLRSKAIDTRAYVEVGLLKVGGDSGLYDGFRNRVTFPIRDQAGRIVGFGGRTLGDDPAKYLNSPESRLFDKSSVLYGLHQANRSIQSAGVAIVCEGYTDVIACHQAGFTNVVATLGTSLTRGHAALLRRLCGSVVLLFDGDEAGRKAADRAVDVFFAESLDVRIATLSSVTDAKDPDELLRRDRGRDTFERVIEEAKDLLEYRLGGLRASIARAGPGRAARLVEDELSRLVSLGFGSLPPLRQQLVLRQMSRIVGVDEATLRKALPRSKPAGSQVEVKVATRPMRTFDWALGCVLVEPSLHCGLLAEACPRSSGEADAARIVESIEAAASAGRLTLEGVLDLIDDAALQGRVVDLHDRVERETSGNRESVRRLWSDVVGRLQGEAGEPGQESLPVAERLRAIRERHRASGGNRASLPRVV